MLATIFMSSQRRPELRTLLALTRGSRAKSPGVRAAFVMDVHIKMADGIVRVADAKMRGFALGQVRLFMRGKGGGREGGCWGWQSACCFDLSVDIQLDFFLYFPSLLRYKVS